MTKKTKKILMTGSGGFVGKNILPYLRSNGFEVVAPRSKNFDFTDTAAVQNLLKQEKPDILLLAGFYGINDVKNIAKDIYEVNLKIFNNFVDNFPSNKHIFTFGSGAEFNKAYPIIKAKESELGKNIPQDLYGNAKYKISEEIKKHPNVYNLRLFGVYGPGELESRFPTHAIKQNLAGQAITIRQNVFFDYLWTSDLCKIVLEFLNNPPSERFINLTPTKSISLEEISNIVNEISPFKSQIITAKSGLANEYSGDNTLLCQLLPNLIFTTYKEGIKQLYQYLKNEVSLQPPQN
ncbi:MAG: NAD(P)-dependent oxidoreductase [Elusimicrobiota bacterium]|jgi:GDP-L-fucose synthase|nr:NAD(P)-dependent oxidoreductase [Elusimicrobiota bacterium]